MSQWISVRDELPSCEEYLGSLDVSKCVLIYTTDKIISVAHLTNHLYIPSPLVWAKCNCDYLGLTLGEEQWNLDEVTHWMPLPEAPKGDK